MGFFYIKMFQKKKICHNFLRPPTTISIKQKLMSMVQPRVSDWGQFVDILGREHELMIMMMSALYYEPQHAQLGFNSAIVTEITIKWWTCRFSRTPFDSDSGHSTSLLLLHNVVCLVENSPRFLCRLTAFMELLQPFDGSSKNI